MQCNVFRISSEPSGINNESIPSFVIKYYFSDIDRFFQNFISVLLAKYITFFSLQQFSNTHTLTCYRCIRNDLRRTSRNARE